MKTTIVLTSLFLAGTASAASIVHDLSCVTAEAIESRGHRGTTKFAFSVANLERGKVRFELAEDEENPVKMRPENSILFLNDNYGISRKGETVVLEADAAGCQLTTVVLYGRSGYTRGYARTKDIGCGKDAYTAISCSVRERE